MLVAIMEAPTIGQASKPRVGAANASPSVLCV